MALICLKSLLATSQEELQLVVHDDGSLTDEDQALIRDELPKALVVSRDQADGELARPLEAFPTLKTSAAEAAASAQDFSCAYALPHRECVFCR